MAEFDWDGDPCARAAALRAARYRLASGQQEATFAYTSNEVTRSITYSRADMDRLDEFIRTAEAACAVKTGQPPPTRRSALVGGSRGYGGAFGYPWWRRGGV